MTRIPPIAMGLALAAAFLAACFEGTTGGSETTNGLSGVIRDGEGRPAASAEVALVPEAFRPIDGGAGDLPRTRTDAEGRYRFGKIDPGTYNLEARDSARGLKLLLRGVRIGKDPGSTAIADGALATSGILRIPFADRNLPPGAVAWIPGTTWQARVEVGEAAFLELPRLPAGAVPSILVAVADPSGGYVLARDLEVRAGGVTDVPPLLAWARSQALRLDLKGLPPDSLAGHPALLRLHAGNFDFSQAGPGGVDLRIAGPGGAALRHQVQHWDSVAREAAVWVRLDAPSGNPGDTSISLHWGRVDASDRSSGSAVFDSARGFASVWHLRGAGAAGLRDATGRTHLTPLPGDSSAPVAGPAGSGRRFAGTGGLESRMPAGFGGNASFTVSFWTRFQADSARRQTLMRFGLPMPMRGFHFLIRRDTTAQIGPWDSSPDASPSAAQNHFPVKAFLDQWVHVASVYDAAAGTVTTYLNGALMASNNLPALDVDVAAGVRVAVPLSGSNETGLHGSLAEVRFVSRPLGAAWIKAEYESTREGGALLELR